MSKTQTADAIEGEVVAPKPSELIIGTTPIPSTLAPEAATIFSIIERAARDPAVDIDKMERLILMQERMQTKTAALEFVGAMAATQKGMGRVRADANNPQTKSKYASYGALDAAIRPIYSEHGFSLSFDTADGAPADCVRIVCKVAHIGGHVEYPRIDMPADGKGAKGGDVMTKTHAMGSAVTYGKRYLLNMIFNIAFGNDDDGNAAGGKSAAAGSAGAGGEFRPERRSGLQEAHDDIVEQTGNTTSQYQVDKLKKAIAAGWLVTNTTDKGKVDQVAAYLNIARNPDDVAAILNKNVAVIEGAGEVRAAEINEDAIRLLEYFERQAATGKD